MCDKTHPDISVELTLPLPLPEPSLGFPGIISFKVNSLWLFVLRGVVRVGEREQLFSFSLALALWLRAPHTHMRTPLFFVSTPSLVRGSHACILGTLVPAIPLAHFARFYVSSLLPYDSLLRFEISPLQPVLISVYYRERARSLSHLPIDSEAGADEGWNRSDIDPTFN